MTSTPSEPTAEILRLPKEYGSPSTALSWPAVAERIGRAERYWLASTRSDGAPHVRPIDAIWIEGVLYFGGSPQTVWNKVLADNPAVTIHLEDAMQAVIMEGRAEQRRASRDLAERLASDTTAKYGYPTRPQDYEIDVWTFTPRRVYAWTSLPADATRFLFE